MLDAAEKLLERQHFERLTIQDITREAGVAAGSFYTRFPRKSDLLPVLYARYTDEAERSLFADLDPSGFGSKDNLTERARVLVSWVIRLYRKRRGVLRSLTLYYRTHPEEPTREVRERLGRTTRALVEVLLGARDEIRHADPEWAAHFAVHAIAAACREKILFDDYPLPDESRAEDERLVDELTRMAVGYLRGPARESEAP